MNATAIRMTKLYYISRKLKLYTFRLSGNSLPRQSGPRPRSAPPDPSPRLSCACPDPKQPQSSSQRRSAAREISRFEGPFENKLISENTLHLSIISGGRHWRKRQFWLHDFGAIQKDHGDERLWKIPGRNWGRQIQTAQAYCAHWGWQKNFWKIQICMHARIQNETYYREINFGKAKPSSRLLKPVFLVQNWIFRSICLFLRLLGLWRRVRCGEAGPRVGRVHQTPVGNGEGEGEEVGEEARAGQVHRQCGRLLQRCGGTHFQHHNLRTNLLKSP